MVYGEGCANKSGKIDSARVKMTSKYLGDQIKRFQRCNIPDYQTQVPLGFPTFFLRLHLDSINTPAIRAL